MTTVAVSDLKASLSEFVARVRAGEEVTLTEDGMPVAKLVPLGAQQDREVVMAELVRTGQVRPLQRSLPRDYFRDKPLIEDPEGKVLKFLLEERESGW